MTVALFLFAMALGAGLQGAYLFRAWHPHRARCVLCGTRPTTTAEGVNAAHSSAKHGHDAVPSRQPSAAPSAAHQHSP